MVQHLDRNLYIGGEVKEVYDELVKTIKEDHLRFDLDEDIQRAPNVLKYESSYTSSILKKYGKTKSINTNLLKLSSQNPPWGKMDYRDWNKTPLFDDNLLNEEETKPKTKIPANVLPTEIKPEKIELYKNIDPSSFKNKEFKNWLKWWQTHFTTEDYLKYLSTQTNDYLSLIFHLYETTSFISNGSNNNEEVNLLDRKDLAQKQKDDLISELKKKKTEYQPGYWNPDSILLGGLGKDPEPDENQDPVKIFKKTLESSRPKSFKLQFFKSPKEDNEEEEKAKQKILEMLQEKKTDSPQERLERIWTLLRMSDSSKLDMVIKYSTNAYVDKLLSAISDWELATNLIVQREQLIYDLENFERFASDPNRFFVKGYRGSSLARLDEALKRENFYKQIDELQVKIEAILIQIEKKYKDVVTYNSRPYLEKMKWDRIEMLHYLNEERRIKYFKNEIKTKQLKTNLIEIKS